MPFLFESFDCYRKALTFAEQVDRFLDDKRNQMTHSMRDQLSRASLSIPLNLAEGNGRRHTADKRQFFLIARGSLFECVPLLQILKTRGTIAEATYLTFYAQLEELSKMLSGLVKSTETTAKREDSE